MPQEIFVNGRFYTQAVTGVQRYAHGIVDALGETPLGKQITVVTPEQGADTARIRLRTRKLGRFAGHLWEQLDLLRLPASGILLNLCSTAPLLKRNQIVTIHDAAVFAGSSAFSRKFLLWYQFLLPRLCKRARWVVTVSEFSKRELVKYCNADPEKIVVIPNGVDHMEQVAPDANALEKFQLGKAPYVLAVGSMNPNKNLSLFIKVANMMKESGVEFVVAGGGNQTVFNTPELQSDTVRFLGYVTDSELRALYQSATCFVFPSIYEGFGIPPVEAMLAGCPVVSSNSACMPEVLGDAALFADPGSPEAFAAHLKSILSNPGLREDMRERGLARARSYTWKRSAELFAKLLEQGQ